MNRIKSFIRTFLIPVSIFMYVIMFLLIDSQIDNLSGTANVDELKLNAVFTVEKIIEIDSSNSQPER